MSVVAASRSPAPDLAAVRELVLNAVTSPLTRAMYGKALDDFLVWWQAQGRPAFTRATVQAHRAHLETLGYAAATVNQRLAAIRKLASEAAENGLLPADVAGGILRVRGVRRRGVRLGRWLTIEQVRALLALPDVARPQGLRDRALLALLLGCGLRRNEALALRVEDVQLREDRWVAVDLVGKHQRVRSVAVPTWVKAALDAWTGVAGIRQGCVLRGLNRAGRPMGDALSPQAVQRIVAGYGGRLGAPLTPHDLRRTCAKLCRSAGGELEQIQLLLGHASVQTTERYLGTRQDLRHAPNDRIPVA